MVNLPLVDILHEWGLTEKEAQIYLACLSLGRASVGTIARKSGQNRVTAYTIMHNLVSKGYAKEVSKNGVKYYTVMSPALLEKKREQKLEKLKSYMPELLALDIASQYNKAKVEIYEGVQGLIDMCTMVLDNTSYIHAFLGADTMDHPFKEYMDTVFIPTRVAKGIPIDVIAAFTEADHAYVRTADTSLRRIICIDEPFFTLAGELFLYAPGKLALCLYSNQELLGISITSDHLYQSLYSLFQLVWKLKTGDVYTTLQQEAL